MPRRLLSFLLPLAAIAVFLSFALAGCQAQTVADDSSANYNKAMSAQQRQVIEAHKNREVK